MTDTLSRPTATAPEGLTPPQALEAERSVLAGLMLEHEAIGRAVEQLEPAAFYRTAHQKIYEAILALYNRNENVALKDLLKPAFEHIQKLFERKVQVTGVDTGYDDLNKLTAGFQNSDLIVIAGRPSTGKTSFALNIAENAAIRAKVPVAIFSLEM